VALSQCQFLIAFAGYGFCFLRLIVWPVYVPIAVFILDKKERKTLKWFIYLGIAIALYFFGLLATQHIAIQKINACISYSFRSPAGKFYERRVSARGLGSLIHFKSGYYETNGIIVGIFAIISWLFLYAHIHLVLVLLRRHYQLDIFCIYKK